MVVYILVITFIVFTLMLGCCFCYFCSEESLPEEIVAEESENPIPQDLTRPL
jgi:hypothetical protein